MGGIVNFKRDMAWNIKEFMEGQEVRMNLNFKKLYISCN